MMLYTFHPWPAWPLPLHLVSSSPFLSPSPTCPFPSFPDYPSTTWPYIYLSGPLCHLVHSLQTVLNTTVYILSLGNTKGDIQSYHLELHCQRSITWLGSNSSDKGSTSIAKWEVPWTRCWLQWVLQVIKKWGGGRSAVWIGYMEWEGSKRWCDWLLSEVWLCLEPWSARQ